MRHLLSDDVWLFAGLFVALVIGHLVLPTDALLGRLAGEAFAITAALCRGNRKEPKT